MKIIEKVSVFCLTIAVCLLIIELCVYVFVYSDEHQQPLPLCPNIPPNLTGRFHLDMSNDTMENVENHLASSLETGGYYKPKECIARNRVAILVTCRDREYQMPVFLKNLHKFLMRQQLEYQIFIIFQTHGYWFNKGALYNVGFIESMKVQKWECFIFHDIDMLPMDDRNLYDCPRMNPRHLAVDVDKYGYKLSKENYSGGVFALTEEQYRKVNGHANTFWAWGAEDDDLSNRMSDAGYFLDRYPHQVTAYRSLDHKPSFVNPNWEKHLRTGKSRFQTDGLNSIKYHIKKMETKNTYTGILVEFIPEELNGDPQVLDESNTPGYDETLKLHTTAMTPIDNEESNGIDNSRNAHSPSEVVLSKIDNSEHFNDTMKTSLKKWFSHIFSLLHM